MGKKTRRDNKFFESLALTNSPVGFDESGVSSQWVDGVIDGVLNLSRRTTPFLVEIAGYSAAAAHDIGHYGWKLVSKFFTRQARTCYLALAITGTAAGLAVAFTIASATVASYSGDITSPSTLLNKKNVGTTILDRNGEVLYRAYGAANRQLVELKDMPKDLLNATLAAEDPDFYKHPGFSWRATVRALYANASSGQTKQGGSTITQQLVKNTLLSSQRNYLRKYQEVILASQLENKYSKDEILQMYLNEVYYGQGSDGIGAAAQTYFHKSAKDLTLGQSALLAGLPLGPSRFDPNVDANLAFARRGFVLDQMLQHGFITAEQAKAANAEKIEVFSQQIAIRAPHFVFYVLEELRREYGRELVERGGITVRTTLDIAKQDMGQSLITAQVNKLSDSHHLTNGAMVAVEPKTGEILTMVGSRDYNYPGFGNLNVTTAFRQPGSSFKPFTYITAFKKGWNGSTTVQDTPLRLTQYDGSVWAPMDYDKKFRGEVTIRRALQNSLNVPAVRVMQYAGIAESIQTSSDLGITGLKDATQYGYSFVLGTPEVRPLDMAVAYATIANGGVKVTPKAILAVNDRFGADITKTVVNEAKQVLDPRINYMITNILSDNKARTELFGANSPLRLASRPAAAKTGTTEDFRDDWTVGFTPQLSVAVWMGNNDNTPILGITGIMGAAPIWNTYMERALAGVPAEDFKRPGGILVTAVCGWQEVLLEGQKPRSCTAPKPAAPPKEAPKVEVASAPIEPGMGGVAPAP